MNLYEKRFLFELMIMDTIDYIEERLNRLHNKFICIK